MCFSHTPGHQTQHEAAPPRGTRPSAAPLHTACLHPQQQCTALNVLRQFLPYWMRPRLRLTRTPPISLKQYRSAGTLQDTARLRVLCKQLCSLLPLPAAGHKLCSAGCAAQQQFCCHVWAQHIHLHTELIRTDWRPAWSTRELQKSIQSSSQSSIKNPRSGTVLTWVFKIPYVRSISLSFQFHTLL